ncbi:hypothetical protein CYMTET_35385, partial [Cymbomonas tetramitiformis]
MENRHDRMMGWCKRCRSSIGKLTPEVKFHRPGDGVATQPMLTSEVEALFHTARIPLAKVPSLLRLRRLTSSLTALLLHIFLPPSFFNLRGSQTALEGCVPHLVVSDGSCWILELSFCPTFSRCSRSAVTATPADKRIEKPTESFLRLLYGAMGILRLLDAAMGSSDSNDPACTAAGCPANWQGDSICDELCRIEACNNDNGDCP